MFTNYTTMTFLMSKVHTKSNSDKLCCNGVLLGEYGREWNRNPKNKKKETEYCTMSTCVNNSYTYTIYLEM